MPIYEYRCSACGHQQEFLQKLSDPPHTRCTKCGEESFAKMVTAAGFQLKGSGWYATDFKSDKEQKRNLVEKGEPEPAKAEAKPEGKAEGTTEGKTEGKTDKATEAKPAAKPETRPAGKSRTVVTKPTARGGARSKAKGPARKATKSSRRGR